MSTFSYFKDVGLMYQLLLNRRCKNLHLGKSLQSHLINDLIHPLDLDSRSLGRFLDFEGFGPFYLSLNKRLAGSEYFIMERFGIEYLKAE